MRIEFLLSCGVVSLLGVTSCRSVNSSAAKEVFNISTVYDCNSPRPESPGLHNMVLFGSPSDELYTYHLPLFPGPTNGMTGHVLMHTYQAVWNIELDPNSKQAYSKRFSELTTDAKPFPFFSVAPQGKRFKVPEMICNPEFAFNGAAVSGHVEGNPDFPAPSPLISGSSQIKTKGATVFARRFDQSAKKDLTYFVFGTTKQYYMIHLLTDDESSFDQIVAIDIEDEKFKSLVDTEKLVFVTVPNTTANKLDEIEEFADNKSPNNKFKISATPLKQSIVADTLTGVATGKIVVKDEIYFNKNSDLQK